MYCCYKHVSICLDHVDATALVIVDDQAKDRIQRAAYNSQLHHGSWYSDQSVLSLRAVIGNVQL